MQPGPAGFGGDASARVDADFGYGLPAWRGRGVLTLLGGYGWRERAQPRQTVGALLDRGALNLRLDIERAEGRGGRPRLRIHAEKARLLFGGARTRDAAERKRRVTVPTGLTEAKLVEPRRFELPTSALRTQRSPN